MAKTNSQFKCKHLSSGGSLRKSKLMCSSIDNVLDNWLRLRVIGLRPFFIIRGSLSLESSEAAREGSFGGDLVHY